MLKIDADHATGGPDPLCRYERIQTGATPEIENDRAAPEVRRHCDCRHSRIHIHRDRGYVGQNFERVPNVLRKRASDGERVLFSWAPCCFRVSIAHFLALGFAVCHDSILAPSLSHRDAVRHIACAIAKPLSFVPLSNWESGAQSTALVICATTAQSALLASAKA